MAPAAITSPATFLPDDLKLNSILDPPKVAGPRISASKGACCRQCPLTRVAHCGVALPCGADMLQCDPSCCDSSVEHIRL